MIARMMLQRGPCPKVILGPQMSSKDTTGSSELQIAEPSQCPIEISVPGPSHLDCTLQLCDIKADSAVPSHQPTFRVREHHDNSKRAGSQ